MWYLSGTAAEFSGPLWNAVVPFGEPWQGLTVKQCLGMPLITAPALLRANVADLLLPATPLAEVYVRGSDLVATYVPSPVRPVRLQIYWRALEAKDFFDSGNIQRAAGVELIVSAQTDLLDVRPEITVGSTLPSGEWLCWDVERQAFVAAGASHAGASLFLLRPAGSSFSYVEMIHPSDYAGAAFIDTTTGWQLTWTLFPDHLEKGVIRRSRLRGLFVPREGVGGDAELTAILLTARPA